MDSITHEQKSMRCYKLRTSVMKGAYIEEIKPPTIDTNTPDRLTIGSDPEKPFRRGRGPQLL